MSREDEGIGHNCAAANDALSRFATNAILPNILWTRSSQIGAVEYCSL